MNTNLGHQPSQPFLGSIEPHAALLKAPHEVQLLYKVMSVKNLLRSIEGMYLHFQRVDRYTDNGADPNDGKQTPKDRQINEKILIGTGPGTSGADYYDQSRGRTYACSFSVEESTYLWERFGNGCENGKVCVVFLYGKYRTRINQTLQKGNSALKYNGNIYPQPFDVNYGIIDYIDLAVHQENVEHFPNPIRYTYFKDKEKYQKEKEFRTSLSTIGVGHFVVNDGRAIDFSDRLHMHFDFRAAIADGTIQQILLGPNCNTSFLQGELHKLGISTC